MRWQMKERLDRKNIEIVIKENKMSSQKQSSTGTMGNMCKEYKLLSPEPDSVGQMRHHGIH
jgi:hypothetical protein